MACCCKIKNQKDQKKVCEGCYPNPNVSPLTVKIARIPRAPPYLKPNVKPLNFDYLFPKLPNSPTRSQSIPGPATNVNCEKCAQMIREKDFQLMVKDIEIAQLKKRFGGGAQHNYRAIRRKEFELFRKEQDLARLKMEAAKNEIETVAVAVNEPKCAACTGALRQRERQIRERELEVVRQMASPYIKVNTNPCYCCSGQVKPKADEAFRKKNKDHCFKELQKRETKILKKEKNIDKKIKKFREKTLREAEANLRRIPKPGEIPKELIRKCKCACSKTGVLRRNMDPCSFVPNGFWGSMPCSMPTLNNGMPGQHNECPTKCCVMKLAQNVAACAFSCGPKPCKCGSLPTRLLRWWFCRNTGR